MKNRRPQQNLRKQNRVINDGVGLIRSGLRVSLGIHAIKEVIKVRPTEIVKIIIRQNWESSKDLSDIVKIARKHRIVIEERNAEAIDRIGGHNQGIACEIKGRPTLDLENLGCGKKSIVIVLDGVEDPHNLGAIIRTGWLMGVEAIIVPTDRAVSLVATVHKVSCGGVEHVPVIEVPSLVNTLGILKEKGFWVFGLAAGGKKTLANIQIPEKIVWVLGSEDKGIRSTTERACDELVSIPQLDNAASYNVSVTAGITLYETYRQLLHEKD